MKPVWLAGPTKVPVAGETFHADAIMAMLAETRSAASMTAVLIPEPANAHDPNAVAVYLNSALAGHLPREIAAQSQAALVAFAAAWGGPAWCPAHVIIRDVGPQVLLSLDTDALGIAPEAFDVVPDLARAIQHRLGRLDTPAPVLAGSDDRARAEFANAERARAKIDADYDRAPGDWPAAEAAFSRAAAALEHASDPLVSDAWLGVAQSIRYQPGRRDDFLAGIVEAVYWNRANADAWVALVDYAAAAPHIPTLVVIFAHVPVPARPPVLQRLLSMSRGTDRLSRMSSQAGEQLRAELLAVAKAANDAAAVTRLSRRK